MPKWTEIFNVVKFCQQYLNSGREVVGVGTADIAKVKRILKNQTP